MAEGFWVPALGRGLNYSVARVQAADENVMLMLIFGYGQLLLGGFGT